MDDNTLSQDPLLTATPADLTPAPEVTTQEQQAPEPTPTPEVLPPVDPVPVQEDILTQKVYTSQAEQDGLVEIINADGSKSQVTKEVAASMVANLETLKQQLGGTA